jgi:hypothetical protein
MTRVCVHSVTEYRSRRRRRLCSGACTHGHCCGLPFAALTPFMCTFALLSRSARRPVAEFPDAYQAYADLHRCVKGVFVWVTSLTATGPSCTTARAARRLACPRSAVALTMYGRFAGDLRESDVRTGSGWRCVAAHERELSRARRRAAMLASGARAGV